ncbi:MAG: amidohydrolase family protein [Saprospiraceae bacterium]|nr:amidohydrolase family protein [Saprospiraceae bacterium]
MRKITADWIFPVAAAPVQAGVLIVDDAGKILAIESRTQHEAGDLEVFHGAIVPGFVNTHCHLELSHMLGKVDTGTGLIPFITGVVTKRNVAQELITEAINNANQEMLDGGIVALGDISNAPDTFAVKALGKMRYYTFIELFDFLQDTGAEKAFSDWSAVYDQLALAPGSAKSMVPHAPYTVSKTLFEKINAFNAASGITVSIHNQETPPENALFLDKTGDFIEFYGRFGVSLEQFEATGQPSIYYALRNMNPQNRTLFVHNTLSTQEDIQAAHAWSDQVYWATCPNANLYIENRLPNYQAFLDTQARVTVGTDSLTSNWQLSILEELKTIARYQSYVPFETMLRWATLNGAEALGFQDTLGSFEPGKTPGVLLLEHLSATGGIQAQTSVRRLV